MADRADLLVLCGPTATGKTSLSVALAKALGGEIICADSMQIYKQLTVGTAKVTPAEMQSVPHHLVDFLAPNEKFSVADFVARARVCIEDIRVRGKLPIVVGGTGLYVKSLVEGVSFAQESPDDTVRLRLKKELEETGIEPLYERLLQIDAAYGEAVHKNNHKRVLRALELYEQSGKTMSQQIVSSKPARRPYHDFIVGLQYETREELYEHINSRVLQMMEAGLLAEALFVYENRADFCTAAQAIGYKEFFPYFEQTATLESCVQKLQQSSRNYAKRQLTWFMRMDEIHWMQAGSEATLQKILAQYR